MNKKDLRIVFLGNPEFARYHLDKLLDAGFNIVAVVTAPDKASGRGKQLRPTPVTAFAREKNIPVLQPKNLKAESFVQELRSYRADIQVVIAFRMLPEVVWNMPAMGTVNLHASLLPQYRGAAPINWAIINGEKETGVTTFRLKHEIDTGNILVQEVCPIEQDETAGSLHDKLMHLGADATIRTLEGLLSGEIAEKEQATTTGELKKAPKIFKEDCEIDWNRPAKDIYHHIHGLSPYPAAYTVLNGIRIKVYKCALPEFESVSNDALLSDGKTYLYLKAKNAYVSLIEVQPEGKRPMSIEEFLRGYSSKIL